GAALADLVGDVSAEDAAARPIPGAHTIWELVLHVTAWTEIARQRLASATKPPDPTDADDWPAVRDTSPERWRSAVERLKDAHRELADDVAGVADDSLSGRLPGRDHSATTMLHGIVEHAAYHGGQIALLKRALSRTSSTP
ncbi:MAG TPA: DinB family protein, partial [Gemmatimonadaceae bacterium]|nr:DinB family protein [Gemmatimonadaceae bacterium]